MKLKKKSYTLYFVAVVAMVFSGCSLVSPSEPLTLSGFAFDTTYTLTMYRGGSQELLDHCVSICNQYEEIFSRTREDSELFEINAIERIYAQMWQEETGEKNIVRVWERHVEKRLSSDEITHWEEVLHRKIRQEGLGERDCVLSEDGSLQINISKEMAELVKKGLEYSKMSQGGFDITVYPVSSLWDFTSEQPEIPGKRQIRQAVQYVDYNNVMVDEESITFAMPGMGIDLGGIAKGYIADRLKDYLTEGGVTSGMINLGGNVLCIGRKSKREPFRIGIQQPFADRNETIAVINAQDVSVVSSGIYERYIQDGDRMYHHILNPKTGYSYDNGLIGVTIVSPKSVDGDGISTSAFALGLEEGMKLIDSLEGVEAVFITEDETLHYTDGFQEMLRQG